MPRDRHVRQATRRAAEKMCLRAVRVQQIGSVPPCQPGEADDRRHDRDARHRRAQLAAPGESTAATRKAWQGEASDGDAERSESLTQRTGLEKHNDGIHSPLTQGLNQQQKIVLGPSKLAPGTDEQNAQPAAAQGRNSRCQSSSHNSAQSSNE